VYFIKKPVVVHVAFAVDGGTMSTPEGPVAFEAGDAILTGVRDERWPIARERFEASYVAVPPTCMGDPGSYRKLPLVVQARRVDVETEVAMVGAQGVLRARLGDWIVSAPDGEHWVVEASIFADTYERRAAS
jgi:hypothetical protein